ncbi:MAG: CoA ester lyase [Alphaproteobacteria bacterium]|nr:CoA ester lyase [Alphaproteobacteria bacterium]
MASGSRQQLPLWRSMLFVPTNVEKFVESAPTRGADAYILDLEDSIPAAEKANARTLVRQAAAKVGRTGADVLVRINRPWRLSVRDIEASVDANICALMVPKVADAGHILAIAEILDEVEAERGLANGHTKLFPMIETTDAYFQATEIAKAHDRVVAMNLGSEDFALSAGMLPEDEGLFQPTLHVMMAARAAGVLPLGFIGSIAEYRDRDKFRARIKQAARLGFLGSACIHPLQVDILNEEFTPTEEAVEQSRGIIAAYDEAKAAGRGSIEYDGKMIDEPIIQRAEQVLARAMMIEARSS